MIDFLLENERLIYLSSVTAIAIALVLVDQIRHASATITLVVITTAGWILMCLTVTINIITKGF